MFGFFSRKNERSLGPYNTMGVEAKCKKIDVIRESSQLRRYKQWSPTDYKILGGGSNILITKDLEVPVLKNEIKGKRIIRETDADIVIEVGAGENWHEFVRWCIDNEYGGLENLSLIPGTVGAAPIQNIGAYGVEVKSTIERVVGYEFQTGATTQWLCHECKFEYRDSIFKHTMQERVFITAVQFKLSKKHHRKEVLYPSLQEKLMQLRQFENPTIRQISDAVIAIRRAKLPDPSVLGNAGSFFKNVRVDRDEYLRLKKAYPGIVAFEQRGQYKIASGWMIEHLGWKGKRQGKVGCHEKQALVIVNYGGATGAEIWDFAMKIHEDVSRHFGVQLVPEVVRWP